MKSKKRFFRKRRKTYKKKKPVIYKGIGGIFGFSLEEKRLQALRVSYRDMITELFKRLQEINNVYKNLMNQELYRNVKRENDDFQANIRKLKNDNRVAQNLVTQYRNLLWNMRYRPLADLSRSAHEIYTAIRVKLKDYVVDFKGPPFDIMKKFTPENMKEFQDLLTFNGHQIDTTASPIYTKETFIDTSESPTDSYINWVTTSRGY